MLSKAKSINIQDLASICGGKLEKTIPLDVVITGVSPIETVQSGELAMLIHASSCDNLDKIAASAILCTQAFIDNYEIKLPVIVHPKPYEAYGTIIDYFYQVTDKPQTTTLTGISESAKIDANCVIEENVVIDSSVIIGQGASIGNGSKILSGSSIGENVQIGRNTIIGSNVMIENAYIGDHVVIYNDVSIGVNKRVLSEAAVQNSTTLSNGRVIIQDKVSIGPQAVILNGKNKDTTIGENTKIDEDVIINPEVSIGYNCIVMAATTLPTSSVLDDYVVISE